ncbi:xanthine dehydrogenase accessory protein XdhC [Marinobacterium sp. D7]|uniref:xanthine dehydrogenase accessory protein XdhC n=1 Tax=Marinobacterium ramblicola TaxID=2849041 RepID=UPI001C2D209F|nr:xanthine dehydrogenase accessory protein XdhC [Marinobacterium ramblicola]MBV1788115.1 xanthine dehydrogenase accessory protein XdhC [Marinobacterium ramblicola]
MIGWGEALAELQRRGEAYVMVTLIGTRGSTPRESGTKMIVTAEHSFDTIGGGNLEFQAIAHARELLCTDADSQSLRQYPLGASLGQCCGGQVSVLFEHFAARGRSLLVFGAGHVAQALIPILAELPLRIRWVDNRATQFPAPIPKQVEVCISDDPVEEVERASPGHWMLVLTHNHQLDYELTEAALKRDDIGYLGVIGSQTKARRFRQRLAHRGFSDAQIDKLICPVGLEDVGGKRPMEVAVSISAQLISKYQSQTADSPKRTGVEWRELQSLLAEEAETADDNHETDPLSTRSRDDN